MAKKFEIRNSTAEFLTFVAEGKEQGIPATTENISVVQQEGAREVRRNTLFYNLDAIISVGYRATPCL